MIIKNTTPKKCTKLLLLIVSSLFLTACSSNAAPTKENQNQEQGEGNPVDGEKLKVVATIFPQYDFLRQIGQDDIELTMLLPPGMESHSYEPTPQDMITLSKCDLLVTIGGESDKWVDQVIGSFGENAPKVIKLMDYVPLLKEELVEGMEENHDHEGNHASEEEKNHEEHHASEEEKNHEEHHASEEEQIHEGENHIEETATTVMQTSDNNYQGQDEHIWTSPKNAMKMLEVLGDTLGAMDTKHKETFEKNAMEYRKVLEELDKEFASLSSMAKTKTLIFGDRFPFRYLTEAYDFKYYAAFLGCSTETQAKPTTISFLIDKVNELKSPVIFKIELSSGKVAQTIEEATNANVLTLQTGHTVTKEQLEDGVTYEALMRDNLEILKGGLNK